MFTPKLDNLIIKNYGIEQPTLPINFNSIGPVQKFPKDNSKAYRNQLLGFVPRIGFLF